MAAELTPLTQQEIFQRATSAVDKIDQQGPRGVALCSTEEVEAMALLLAMSGLLPPLRACLRTPVNTDVKTSRTF